MKPQQVKKSRLEVGKKAPFTGFLLSDAALAKLITDAASVQGKLKLRIKYLEKRQRDLVDSEKAKCAAKIDACTKKLSLTEETRKLERNIMNKALDRTSASCERSWYESPILGFAVGASVASGVAIAVAGTK